MSKHFMPRASLVALMAARPAGIVGSVRSEANVDAAKLEKLLNDVNAEVKRVGDEVKQTAEQALQQSKDAGKITDEVKAKADELLTAQSKLNDAQQKITGRLEQLETRNTDLEQRLASRRGGNGNDAVKSLGQMVAESEDVKNFTTKMGAKGTVRITVQNAITSATGSAGDLIVPQRETEIIGIPRRQMTIRQLLQVGRTTSNSVEYARMVSRTNNAGVVAENTLKPESDYVWEQADAPVRTIAHWVPVSRNAMDDIPQLQGEIDGELRYGLDLAEENEILKGDGTGQHLDGLVPNATAYAPAFAPADETDIDTLRLALLQASLAEYAADGIVIHPTRWAKIELTKDGEQRYVFANVIQMAGPQLWGRPVIATQAMDEDEFLTGAFRMAAKIYDRMDVEVLISSEDRDNFVKNMLTVRAEKRLALAIRRAAALVTGEFAG
ncbi:phage major capsid protein [Mesorhizobium sp. BE184]|uniref:phage major capsid protein n=1 Tax=Mesorhizobium sp. BE184 TaxID=2817714 RepID=UPI00285E04EB|nr:phage major capsid protein [Mesorhizobium sp. BE184]MDR7034501.1 HK97 family phage major capsid protein [Mesorhizobium sp. BE184]